MTNLSPEICRKIRDARRSAKLGQTEVASEVGCKQSALSMFEQGQPTKLSEEVVKKLAAKFNIELEEVDEKSEIKTAAPFVQMNGLGSTRGFCPNPHCPSNHSFKVEDRVFYRPNRDEADPAGGKFCALCGEVLEKKCPNCGAPVHAGAVCSFCGEAYIAIG